VDFLDLDPPFNSLQNNNASIHEKDGTETDNDLRHYDRSFNLDQLLPLEFFMVYGSSPFNLFLDYLNRANRLHQGPMWYNAVMDNHNAGIRVQRTASDPAQWDWRMLVNGLGDQLLYGRGVIATNVPFAELKERGHVNTRAQAADKEADISRLIRQGVPGTEQ
jgi:hypothetical protein